MILVKTVALARDGYTKVVPALAQSLGRDGYSRPCSRTPATMPASELKYLFVTRTAMTAVDEKRKCTADTD